MATRLPDSDCSSGTEAGSLSRRQALQALTALGVGSVVFQRALAAEVEKAQRVTPEMIQQAEWIAGLELEEDQRASLARSVNSSLRNFRVMREVELTNDIPPALVFEATPGQTRNSTRTDSVRATERHAPERPGSGEKLAFLPVTELSALLRTGKVSSVELTRLYLKRLKQFDPALHCVVNYTEDLALKQAEKADREIAAGRYRGPLHGIPWGAKDLIAYPGYKTTWGATPFKDQVLDIKATVARRLEEAGAVLVAKLSLGALAQGDRWFGGMTRNPWNPKQGSSGSSAGPACAVAAGLVGFALGSETLGSIVSPCRRCGSSGLRPTFGRVSRYGCMALAWSMDKIGPIARSIEDCALIFAALHGSDGLDPAAVDRPFTWPCPRDLRSLRVGYFEGKIPARERSDLRVLHDLGVKLVPIQLPDQYPISPLRIILTVEAATVFNELTRKGVTEGIGTWPSTFRQGAFIPAVEYLRANRIRTLLMREMETLMERVDLYVGGDDLTLTNLTGHPTAVLPNGFRKRDEVETPFAITFTGRLHGETELLAVAHAYQQATGFHLKHPAMDKVKEAE
jgi:Asp-tRNA(Asn)/Glu-tRNA(Gln) amidotransferase A subunit family amidase/Asp-tRNA(Asn)/Glu-tRNA(Gln) amidotransferase C subunit